MALRLPFHSVLLVAVAGVLAWFLAMAGYSAVTAKCNDQKGYTNLDCGFNHSLKWLMLIFELIIILLSVGAALTSVLGKFKSALIAYVAIATALFIYISDDLVRTTYFQENVLKRAKAYDAYGCAAAGSVLVTIFNLVLLPYLSAIDAPQPKAKPTTAIPTRQVDLGSGPAATKTVEDQKPVTAETNV